MADGGVRPGRGRGRIPEVLQLTRADCGAACLSMVLAYHGKRVGMDQLRELTTSGRDGADAARLLEVARWYGLQGHGLKVENVEDLRYLSPGTILHWGFRHFVVFERQRGGGRVRVVDPAHGRRDVGVEELRRSFTGVALALEPGETFVADRGPHLSVRRYLSALMKSSGVLLRIIAISMLVQLLALAVPLFTGIVVDRVVPLADVHLLTILAGGLAVLVIFQFLSSMVRAHLLLYLRTTLDAKLTTQFVDHLVDLPYSFFQRRSAGDLLMRLGFNATIREILTSSGLSGVLDSLLVSTYLVLLLLADVRMGLLVLVLGLLRVATFWATRHQQQQLLSESLVTQARSRNFQVEMLSGMETLKAMGIEREAADRWSHLFTAELNVEVARGKLSALFDSFMGALALTSPLAILAYGALLVLRGEMSLGSMLAVSAIAGGFLAPLGTLLSTALQLQLIGSYLERIEEVMQSPREQEAPPAPPQGRSLGGRIALENVSFRYGPSSPRVIEDVSLEIEPGQFVALVGPSGAGKSTLAALMLALQRPETGRVLFDGVDLNDLNLRWLRSQIGVVPQHSYLFGTSIRGNIALGDPGVSLAQVIEAARLSEIDEEITLMPMRYETLLADGGASLSGGQRQRLALARALLRKPAILLLDEATSSLDSETERRIQLKLQELQITRVVIAHRLSTVRAADLIVVLEKGRIVQKGTHRALMERPGRYRTLVTAQLEMERSG